MASKTPQNSAAFRLEELLETAHRFLKSCENKPGTKAHDSKQLSRSLLESIGAGTASDDTKRSARLHVGGTRKMYCDEAGIRTRPDQKIEAIAATVGEQRWRELVEIFSGLPRDFELYIRRPRELLAGRKHLITSCRRQADLLEQHNLDNQTDFMQSPFHGLLAKQVFTTEWFFVLTRLRSSKTPRDIASDVANKCFFGLYMADVTKVLTRILRDYAEALEAWKPDDRVNALLQFAYGKLNEKEFVKRVVFFLLDRELNRRRAPNKETAIVVNAILGLRGTSAVTANNITQMNKKTRKRYFKEAESYVTWREP